MSYPASWCSAIPAGIVARGCFREWTWALDRDLRCVLLDHCRGATARLCGVTILDDGIFYRLTPG
jgi:hypothetical protein